MEILVRQEINPPQVKGPQDCADKRAAAGVPGQLARNGEVIQPRGNSEGTIYALQSSPFGVAP